MTCATGRWGSAGRASWEETLEAHDGGCGAAVLCESAAWKWPFNLQADNLRCNPIPLYPLKELHLRFLIVDGCQW